MRGHPLVDEIILFDRSAGVRGFLDIRRALRERAFDLVIDLQVYFKAGIITSFTRAPVKLGFDRARARDFNWLFTNDTDPAAHRCSTCRTSTSSSATGSSVPHEPVEWGLGPWAGERAWQREFYSTLERPAAPIVVATSKPDKDWMPERWAEVCDALYADFGLQPVLVGGRSPREEHAGRADTRARASTSRSPRWDPDCASSSRFSTARRSCCRPTPGRCT